MTEKFWQYLDQDDILELLKDGYDTQDEFVRAVALIEAAEKRIREKNNG